MKEQILRKIRGLFALAQDEGATEAEAANAAARAQVLMEKHQIHEAMLDVEEEKDAASPDVGEQTLERMGRRKVTWKGALADGISKANRCRVYFKERYGYERGQYESTLEILGDKRDVEVVKELYAHIVEQMDRMAKQYKGMGRTFLNNWRLGVAATLKGRLMLAAQEARQEMKESAEAGTALLVLDQALATLDRRWEETMRQFQQMNMSKSKANYSHDQAAYAMGQLDGHSVDIQKPSKKVGDGSAE